VRSWETSFTNEFLTQMERFNGILICTTNRLKDLDSASIRRFNHKIEFRYLTMKGSMIFYNLFLASFTSEGVNDKLEDALSQMTTLTPGDFRVVRDRYSFANKEDINHDELILALQDECRVKETYLPSRKGIGF
jgi:transitional endoplasmic reticulum ATPase